MKKELGNNHKLDIQDGVIVRDDFKALQYQESRQKFKKEVKVGWELSGDIRKHPEGVAREQVVDRVNDQYFKKVVDQKSGELTKYQVEKLSEHYGGSQK